MKIELEDIIEQIGLHIDSRQLKFFCTSQELINEVDLLKKQGQLSNGDCPCITIRKEVYYDFF